MEKLRIISRLVNKKDTGKTSGYLCVNVNKAMLSIDDGFRKMSTISEMYSKDVLIAKVLSGDVVLENAIVDSTGASIVVTDCIKGKEIVMTTEYSMISNTHMPLMLIGKIIYPNDRVGFRVSNGLGCVHEIDYNNLIDIIVNRKRTVVNCKLVNKDGRYVVSSIKGELPVKVLKGKN